MKRAVVSGCVGGFRVVEVEGRSLEAFTCSKVIDAKHRSVRIRSIGSRSLMTDGKS
jgi:hypothetical protein